MVQIKQVTCNSNKFEFNISKVGNRKLIMAAINAANIKQVKIKSRDITQN